MCFICGPIKSRAIPDTLLEDFKKAEQLYVEAIALDPKFALAHARLGSTRAQIFHYYEPPDSWKTNKAARRRRPHCDFNRIWRRLTSRSVNAFTGWMEITGVRWTSLTKPLQLSPNNGDVSGLIAALKRRQGKWPESLEAYERASKIDPQNPNIVRNLVFTNTALRRWPEASRAAERMRAMAPASLVAKIQSGYVDFWWKGDTGPAEIVAQ